MEFEVIVRAVIRKGRKLLIGKKRSDIPHPLQGQWHFVGGRLEYDENPWDAVVREVREETNIKVKPVKIIDTYSEFLVWPEESIVPSQYTLHIIFDCLAEDGVIRAGDDIEDLKWIDISEVYDYLSRDTILNSEKLKEFLKKLNKSSRDKKNESCSL